MSALLWWSLLLVVSTAVALYKLLQRRRASTWSAAAAAAVARAKSLQVGPGKQRVFVIVNPCAGGNAGELTFRDVVAPMLAAAGVSFEHVLTCSKGHLNEIARTFDASAFECVLFVGGDGTLHEFINASFVEHRGLARLDGVHFAVVPTGTCNMLALALGYSQPWEPVERLLAFLRGEVEGRRVDLYKVILPLAHEEVTVLDFACTCWGVLADIDLQIERCRGRHASWWREALKVLLPLKEVLFMRSSPATVVLHTPEGKPVTITNDFSFIAVQNVARTDASAVLTPDAKADDGLIHALLWRKPSSSLAALSAFLAVEEGEHVGKPGISVHPARALELTISGGELDICGSGYPVAPNSTVRLEVLPSALAVI
eukprot:TRINITY_DN6640_c1_g2_i1.p1 TRINITY_DN6640_c1_g2~~TRINITY_DN6640_c1_g2_i1.p1  ORF type:complete len:372 (-),score=63.15 TRINITY_DN6640_c1_g2_i1:29-1144(-)